MKQGENKIEFKANSTLPSPLYIDCFTVDGTFGYATQPEPEPINGKLVQNLLVEDRENAADWSIGYDFAEGSLLYGDRDITCASLPEEFVSAEYIRPDWRGT